MSTEFKVGDRVRFDEIKKEGRIVVISEETSSFRYGCLFDDFYSGHSLAGFLTGADYNRGYWCKRHWLSLVEEIDVNEVL